MSKPSEYLLRLNAVETKRAILESEPATEDRDSELRLLNSVIAYLKEGEIPNINRQH